MGYSVYNILVIYKKTTKGCEFMSEIMGYNTTAKISPDMINIRIDDHFYTHHGHRPEDWALFLEKCKYLPEAIYKHKNNISLNETEQEIYDKFFNGQEMLLSLTPEGKLCIDNGRHRMQALKELGITIELPVISYLHIDRVVAVDDVYKKKGLLFKRTSNKIRDDISYFIVEKVNKNLKKLKESDTLLVSFKSLDQNEYLLISREQAKIDEQLRLKINDMIKNNDKIYTTKQEINIQHENELEEER